MENQNNDCEKLIKKYRELKAGIHSRIQNLNSNENIQSEACLSKEVIDELKGIMKILKDKCPDSKTLTAREKMNIKQGKI